MKKIIITVLISTAMVIVMCGCGQQTISGFQRIGSQDISYETNTPSDATEDTRYDVTSFENADIKCHRDETGSDYLEVIDKTTDKSIKIKPKKDEWLKDAISDGETIYYSCAIGGGDQTVIMQSNMKGEKSEVVKIKEDINVIGCYGGYFYCNTEESNNIKKGYGKVDMETGDVSYLGKGWIIDSCGQYMLIDLLKNESEDEYFIYNAESEETMDLPDNTKLAAIYNKGVKYITEEKDGSLELKESSFSLKHPKTIKTFETKFLAERMGDTIVTLMNTQTGITGNYDYETGKMKKYDDCKYDPMGYFAEYVDKLDYTIDEMEWYFGTNPELWTPTDYELDRLFMRYEEGSTILYEFDRDTEEEVMAGLRLGREASCIGMHGDAEEILGIEYDMPIEVFEELTGTKFQYCEPFCDVHTTKGMVSDAFFSEDAEQELIISFPGVKEGGMIHPDSQACIQVED